MDLIHLNSEVLLKVSENNQEVFEFRNLYLLGVLQGFKTMVTNFSSFLSYIRTDSIMHIELEIQ